MQWYYSKNSTQLGPISDAEIRGKLASGEIGAADMVWKEGMSDWLPVSRVPELSAIIPSQQAPMMGQPSPYQSPTHSPYQTPMAPGTEIPNYLWQSIVVTVLCCWPLGIPAIVYAAKVDGMKARGDIQGAMSASANAKKWCIISLAVWGVLIALYLLLMVGGFVMSSSRSSSVPSSFSP
jgi:Interferon-induced transmembrane protein/GYF domain 2